MNRRSFVRRSVAGAAGAAVTSVSVRTRAELRDVKSPSPAPFELDEVTIADLQRGMSSGKYTAELIALNYLDRIDRIDDTDKNGPSLNSVIEVNPEALAIAVDMDKERKAGRVRGPLHGIPMLIKDNIDTHDRMMTTAGSLALQGSIPPQDSTVAKKLRDAGAVIIGKTNLSEWAIFVQAIRRVAGAGAADRQRILMFSIATRAVRVPGPGRQSRRTWRQLELELKPMVQWFVLRMRIRS